MNANKLADLIEKANHCGYNLDAAALLRQQQYEIESLKSTISKITIDHGLQTKPQKYSDEWWKEVEEFNKKLKAQKND